MPAGKAGKPDGYGRKAMPEPEAMYSLASVSCVGLVSLTLADSRREG